MNQWQRWLMAALVTVVPAAGLALMASARQDSLAADRTIYVDADAAGANNGTSWDDAYTALQPALDTAITGNEIWVAAGVYTPTHEFSPGDSRSATFQLKKGVALYGGFDPSLGDTGWEDRDWVSNVVTLSGDIGTQGNSTDNSYHVFYHPAELALDGSAVLDGFTVSGGKATGADDPDLYGGGMFNDSSSPTVTHCTFSGNSAYEGGGLYNIWNSSPALTDCTFSGNSATMYGGGMHNDANSSPTVAGCTFSGNQAYEGGGMRNDGYSSPVVTNSTFSGNSTSYGGGMYNIYSSPMLTNCIFSGNSAADGGGMYNVANSLPALNGCTFSDNTATWSGGGMYNNNSSPTVTSCIFDGNSADSGGGMYNSGQAAGPMLTNCRFSGNLARQQSGGGMVNGTYASPMLANCTFSGNSAPNGPGGGMYNGFYGSPILTNCTFSGNSAAAGGGMASWDSSPMLANCILWANSVDQIANNNSSTVVIYSDVQGGYAGDGNIDADPLLADPGTGNHHLTPNSPCIDAGTNDVWYLPAFDFEGDPRRMDGNRDGTVVVDMGVDEVYGYTFYLPLTTAFFLTDR